MTPRRSIICALVSIVISLPAAAQNSAVVAIPGGQLDTSITGADAYVGDPKPADPGSNPACRLAKVYVDKLGAGKYDEMASLFAEDAVILDPLRKSVNGHLNIADFYKSAVGSYRPQVIGVALIGQGDDCILELAAKMNVKGVTRYALTGLDHFTLNSAGKFSRMVVFLRPAGTETLVPAATH